MTTYQIIYYPGSRDVNAFLEDYPNDCPSCHQKITPNYNSAVFNRNLTQISALLTCPNPYCETAFVANYFTEDNSGRFYFNSIFKIRPQKSVFANEIEELSPSFVKIYNEAYFAEQNDLFEICGVGYRKALEFLIKDYLIKNDPDNTEVIKTALLGRCIKDFVRNEKIKDTAERATWLGNDHAHYIKKWETKDLADLKLLIKLSVVWIESEIITEQLVNSMTR